MQNLSYENEFDLHENETSRGNTLSYDWFRPRTGFVTEAKSNSAKNPTFAVYC